MGKNLVVGPTWHTITTEAARAHMRARGREPLRANDASRSPLYLSAHADAILDALQDTLNRLCRELIR
jgi:hypothetical protein